MKASKGFSYTIIFLFFISLILSYFEFLLINERVILRVESIFLRFELIFLAFWNPLTNLIFGYPFDILILISLTVIAFYALKYLGIKIR